MHVQRLKHYKTNAMAAAFKTLSPEDVCDYLKQQIPNISEEILVKVLEHKIDGGVFIELNDEYLREIAPLLGDRLKMRRAINKVLVDPNVSHII